MRIRQPTFRRGAPYVAVRPIKVSADTVINPGEKIDPTFFRRFHMMTMHRRRLIGIEGDEWTKEMLAVWNFKEKRDDARAKKARAEKGKAEPKTEEKAPEPVVVEAAEEEPAPAKTTRAKKKAPVKEK